MGNNCCVYEQNSSSQNSGQVGMPHSIPPMHPKVHSLIDSVYKGSATQVSIIDLSNREIGEKSAKYLSVVLPYYSHVTRLCLKSCNLTFSSVDSLCQSLHNLSQIEALELDYNHIEPYGGFVLGETLETVCGLKVLSVEACNLGIGVEGVLNGVVNCRKLVELNLSKNEIGVKGAVMLGRVLKHLEELKVLGVAQNEIRDEGAQAIAEGLSPTQLRKIVLTNNYISDEGAVCLVKKLNLSLEELFLETNLITDEGGKNIALELQKFKKLSILCLDSNDLGKKTAEALMSVLPNLKLNLLGLSECSLSNYKKALSLASVNSDILF